MSNYQMNCAIIYFCLLIGCRFNEPNDQISERRFECPMGTCDESQVIAMPCPTWPT